MCLSPLLIVHAFTNWDLLAIGMTGGAMVAWARERPVLAGALFGLGAAAKLYPVLLLGPLLILCLRAGRMPAWTRRSSPRLVWLVINVPITGLPGGLVRVHRLNSSRGAEYDSWYFIYTTLTGSSDCFGGDSADAAQRAVARAVRRRLRGDRLVRAVRRTASAVRPAGLPGGRGVPVDQQGVVAAVLPVAAAAGGSGMPRWRPVLAWQFSEASSGCC